MTYIVSNGSSGSSSAEYIELYEKQPTLYAKWLDYTDWMSESSSEGDGYRAMHLYTGGNTKIIHNSISTSDMDLKSNLSGTFHSWYPDEVFFIKQSSSAKYWLEVRLIIVCDSSSAEINYTHLKLNKPNPTTSNPTPVQSGGGSSSQTVTCANIQHTIASHSVQNAGFMEREGNICDIRYTAEITPFTDSIGTLSAMYYYGLDFHMTLLPKHEDWGGSGNRSKIGISERFITLTKIA